MVRIRLMSTMQPTNRSTPDDTAGDERFTRRDVTGTTQGTSADTKDDRLGLAT